MEWHERKAQRKVTASSSVARGGDSDSRMRVTIDSPYSRKKRKVQPEVETIHVSSSQSSPSSPVLSETSQGRLEDDPPMPHREEQGASGMLDVARNIVEDTEDVPRMDNDMQSPPIRRLRTFETLKMKEKATQGGNYRSTVFQPATPFAPPKQLPGSRPSFARLSIPSRSSSGATSSDMPNLLPDALSPSKRRGRTKDYIRNGMAETMVDWILAMGHGEEARTRNLQQSRMREEWPAARGPDYERIVHVVEISNDENDRGVIVRGHDDRVYLLAGHPANVQAAGSSAKVHIGSRIGVRKGDLSWQLNLGSSNCDTEVESNSPRQTMTASALWDLEPS